MLKYGTKRFQPHQMNSVLVETREEFTVPDGNILRDSFAKTRLLPLNPPKIITNIQACVDSIQISSKGINKNSEDTISPIKFLTTRTHFPVVIIRAKGSIQQPPRKILLQAAGYNAVRKRTVLPPQDIKR